MIATGNHNHFDNKVAAGIIPAAAFAKSVFIIHFVGRGRDPALQRIDELIFRVGVFHFVHIWYEYRWERIPSVPRFGKWSYFLPCRAFHSVKGNSRIVPSE